MSQQEDLKAFLESAGLGEYLDNLIAEDISDLTSLFDLEVDDLKELGFSIGHRKKLQAAIASQAQKNTEPVITPSSDLTALLKKLPEVIAIPLKEYASEDNPGMKLWFACDAIELLIRLIVITEISDLGAKGGITVSQLKQLSGKIEMPTLGAWMAMAKVLAEGSQRTNPLFPEFEEFVNGPLTSLLYGPQNPGTPDTSFLALRNRLAHGGGLSKREAARLLDIWQRPFESCLNHLGWIDEVIFEQSPTEGQPSGLVIKRNQQTINLWPLLLLSTPITDSTTDQKLAPDPITQIYVRRDIVRLQYTPIGAEGFSQTELGEDAVDAFKELLGLDKRDPSNVQKFTVQDFSKEIERDASQMVGRHEEQTLIEKAIAEKSEGIVWVTGPAGIGKSYLMARLMRDCTETWTDASKHILPYRFKASDNSRCNRETFATYLIERVSCSGALTDQEPSDIKGPAIDRLRSCLTKLKPDQRLVIMIDGLDEIHLKDPKFTQDFLTELSYSGILWVCAGRPEKALEDLFSSLSATRPFPKGLPPLRTSDIRGMILEKIGPLKKRLIKNDVEREGEVINPFIDLVATRAEGLPLYVKYVIGDVLANRYRVLDGHETLPKSLHNYHEQLLDGLAIGDLKFILTPLAATLAVAFEPLALHEIQTILAHRNIVPNTDTGRKLVEDGLSAIAPMLRTAPDPEGEDGFALFHLSLRDHILQSESMSNSVEMAREAFVGLVDSPDQYPSITNYLYRSGIDHLIDAGNPKKAALKLLQFSWLENLFTLGKSPADINGYWSKLPITIKQIDACYLNRFKPIPTLCIGPFGSGTEWARAISKYKYGEDPYQIFRSLQNFWALKGVELRERERERERNFDEFLKAQPEDDETNELIELLNSASSVPTPSDSWEDYCLTESEYWEDISDTVHKMGFYPRLWEFFQLAGLTHSAIEVAMRMSRVHHVENDPESTEMLLAMARLSASYALFDDQAADTEIGEEHLLFNEQKGVRHLPASCSVARSYKSGLHEVDKIFRCCLKIGWEQLDPTSSAMMTLINNPAMNLPGIGNLNISFVEENLTDVSDLLKEVVNRLVSSRGANNLQTLHLRLSLAERLAFEMDLPQAKEILDAIVDPLTTQSGMTNQFSIRALALTGDVELELGNMEKARSVFQTMIESIDTKFVNPRMLNTWRSQLLLTELALGHYDSARALCAECLELFDDTESPYFYSLADDRTAIIVRASLAQIEDLNPIKNTEEKIDLTETLLSKNLYEALFFRGTGELFRGTSPATDILKFRRTLRRPNVFRENITLLLDNLTLRQAKAIRMRYGLGRNPTHSLSELASRFEEPASTIKEWIEQGLTNLKLAS
jgi:tetratricopeptide (TPR) repeat protein